jgi:hypothetical protein
MENPFVFSDIVFDGDYTPEGAALNLTRHLGEKHALKLNAGGFALWESSGSPRDAYLVGGQLRLDSTWSPKWQSSVGIGLLDLIHSYSLLTNNVPRVNRGNARTAAGQLVNEYSPLVLDGSLTYLLESFPGYTGAFPLKVAGEYLVNHRVSKQNDAWSVGLTLGKSGKKGLWDIAYRYKCIEPEAWWDELADSDFGAYYAKSPYGNGYFAGTNVRGHVLKATYSPFDSMTLAVTCFLTDLVHAYPNPAARSAKSDATRLQVDMSWKF